ncbi:proton channel OTOP2-like [Amblyraja radiata]|uniref:proton channel OTOP2-like n=1 Tax=Amblyraja radiata TaxID=386614 RepID=UPI00140344C7|nr:proton channel OTOP2-like [Amblyraja radiata]
MEVVRSCDEITEGAVPAESEGRGSCEHGVPPSPHPRSGRLQRQGGRLLSGLLAANILFLGGALICGGVLSEVPVHEDEVMVMLTAMMVLAVVWMVVYISCTARHRTAPLYKDPHAAPVWLRGGLLVLGACSVLHDIFKLVRAAGFPGCEHPIQFLFPSAEILFLFTQSYFLWVHSKDCVQVHQHFTRCGLAISLVTNLMLWMSAAAEESLHHTGVQGEVPEDQSRALTDLLYLELFSVLHPDPETSTVSPCCCHWVHNACEVNAERLFFHWKETHGAVKHCHPGVVSGGSPGHEQARALNRLCSSPADAAGDGCVCSTRVCRILQAASPYLYPFNIEYSLLSSALCFVMWRNVGRAGGGRAAAELKPARGSAGAGPGPALGAGVLLAGLVVSIVYQVEVKEARTRSRALLTYYTFHSAALALMSAACVLGSASLLPAAGTGSHGRGPAGSLDQGLLLGAAAGPLLTCYFSLVAVVWSRRPGPLHALSLVFSLLSVAQHSLQNLFILGALRWPAALDAGPPLRPDSASHPSLEAALDAGPPLRPDSASLSFPQASLSAGFPLPPASTSHPSPQTAPGPSLPRTSAPTPRDPAGGVSVPGTVAASSPESRQRPHPPLGARRRLLREVSSFLLLCNILLWAVSAFGARPHFANDIEEKFYGFQTWAAIVNTGLPLGIFYRMHSAANLLEIYLRS